jgi:hypothetical protein
MFCPKCGLQQTSEAIRFCSRCGLSLGGLTQWLSGNAVLVTPDTRAGRALSPRSKSMKHGAKVMFAGGVLTPIFFGFCFLADSPGPLLFPFIVFLVGLAITLYARLFLETAAPINYAPPQVGFVPTTEYNALPQGVNQGFAVGGNEQVRTSELVQPNSVTENTTRLLDN